ncbi:hypothetical protein MMC22_006563 [Lobaria immixta]|nr:hypothetical protein [Lobaria immixta]
MSSLNNESFPSSQPFQSAQPRQDERDPSTQRREDSSPHPANSLDSTAKTDHSIQHDLASPTASTSQVDEHLSYLSEETSDQSEAHPESRSNKYNGPQSTWRSWTVPERGLAESLDKLTAKDLAVHLYNAYALKERARKMGAQKESQTTDNGHGTTYGQGWMPPKSWTAWPLPPDLVPREIDGPHWNSSDFCQPSHSDSKCQAQRQDLQDLLVAQVIKKAKKRNFYLREKEGERRPPGTEPEALSMELSDDSSISNKSESPDELEPVIMLDDEVAINLLQPIVHHILTKLDGLLEGLHHTRNAHRATDGSDDHESACGRSKKKRSIPRSEEFKGNTSEASVQSLASGPETDFPSDNELTAKISRIRQKSRSSVGQRQNQRPRRRRANCGLRDWSDVLGVASMTGWDSTIVQKAAFRCSTLFKAGIKFRRLEENGNDSNEILVLPNTSFSRLRSTSDEMLQVNPRSSSAPVRVTDSQGLESEESSWKIHCPVSTCNRFSRGFSSSYALKRHLKQVHQGEAALEKLGGKESEEEMVGGVHVDGFLQPIPRAESWIAKERPPRRKGRSDQPEH